MSILKSRVAKLDPTFERRTFIVTAGDAASESEVREAVYQAGYLEPFDVIHVVEECAPLNVETKIIGHVTGGLRDAIKRGTRGEA